MFTLTINTDNAAFEGDDLVPELVRIIDKLADRLALAPLDASDSGLIIDVNGNTVGEWTLADNEEVK